MNCFLIVTLSRPTVAYDIWAYQICYIANLIGLYNLSFGACDENCKCHIDMLGLWASRVEDRYLNLNRGVQDRCTFIENRKH